MPAGDGTGPAGLGPMTGRAAGYCAGYSVPGYANPIRGWGYGRGWGYYGYGRGRGGGGRGWRNQFYATGLPYWARGYMSYPGPGMYGYGYGYSPPELTGEAEAKILKDQAEFMQKEITAIQDRIRELENLPSDKKDKS